jgi:hypothetical protein
MTVVVVGTGVVLVVKLKDEVLSVSLSQLLTVLQHVEFIQLSDVSLQSIDWVHTDVLSQVVVSVQTVELSQIVVFSQLLVELSHVVVFSQLLVELSHVVIV